MVFSSMIFLWAFLPIVFILDKIAGKSRKLQNILLLAASLLFYAWGRTQIYVAAPGFHTGQLCVGGFLWTEYQAWGRRKFILIAGILVNLGNPGLL